MTAREQQRSLACWARLASRFDPQEHQWSANRRDESTYLAALKKTSSRVYISGLGMAIAFLRSRNKPINGNLADDIGRLTLAAMGRRPGRDPSLELIQVIRGAQNVATVAWATEEALAACTWLMRYLEGAGVEAKEEDHQGGGDVG